MTEKEIDVLAKRIWDYHFLNQPLRKADIIFGLSSNDLRIAEWSAHLFLEGYAPLIVFSGGISHIGDLLEAKWKCTDAEIFAETAIKLGVPKEKILLESKATNTGENVVFTRKLLEDKGIDPKSFILVQKPHMQRRVCATFKKLWPGKDFVVSSPPLSFEEFSNEDISKEDAINLMVGDLQRIKEYPQKGFAIEQEIPKEVWEAYEQLVKAGFTKHLIKF
ncbi:MAG: YdcF family protein [Candidatus Pacebacteria bacterium]|nr:YdcF family protein [Candidatus Paceibacterota bacterium]MDD5356554.1 YdcF family protein [Candidatus Paceibacterota bacterium]